MKRGGSVYILTNISNDVLYIGVTADLFLSFAEFHNDQWSYTKRKAIKKLA